jgi:glucose-1-phosphate cytidylyltransferase
MKFSNNFFTIILIGGMGTRFSKINEAPKQLIKLNKKSLLENLIISFVKNGINNFVLPLGHKKKFFINFFKKKKKIFNKNVKIYENKPIKLNQKNINIVLFDAGKNSSKLQRIKKSINFFESENFMFTYGDGIADINLKPYIKIYNKHRKAIIATKYVNSQYGHLKINKEKILAFNEKPIMKEPINIGYYLFSKKLFNHFYKGNFELENQFIKKLINKNKIVTYTHKGFFFNIDRKIDLINIKKKYKKILFRL